MKILYKLLAIILFSTAAVFADAQKVALTTILESELETGDISRAEYVAYRLMSLTFDERLPQKYRGYEPDQSRMGTSLKMEARTLLDQAAGSDAQLLQSVLTRPVDLPLSFISPSGLFKIHYTNEGSDAAADSFITLCAQAYDDVFDLQVNQLGYPAPPIDDPSEPEYDVYVYNLSGYGFTTAESSSPRENYPYAYTSYIEMDNDFSNTYTKGVDGMLVTAAHEFFHVVQIGMRSYTVRTIPSAWLYEGMATWMEDYAYNEVNDYLQYLPSYLSSTDQSFNTFNGLNEYGTCIFYHMLEKKYGVDIIKTIWQKFAQGEVWDALENALKTVNSSLAYEFSEHMLWNYFTGERADPVNFYPEGEYYPFVKVKDEYDINDVLSFANNLMPLSAEYVVIHPQAVGQLLIEPVMATPADWMVSAIQYPIAGEAEVSISGAKDDILLSEVNPADEIILVPTNIKIPKDGMGKSEYSFNLNLGEITDLVPGIRSIAPNPFQPKMHMDITITVRLSEKTKKINWMILNETGLLIRKETLLLDSKKNGDFDFIWDGRNDNGDLVASGIYLFYVDAAEKIEPGKIAVIH